jgi:arabinofuranosyltransferase
MWALIGLVGLTPSVLLSPRALVLAAALVVAGGALVREAPLYNGARFGARSLDPFDHFGVTDERRFYYPTMGLLPRLGLGERPTEPLWKTAGKSVRARGPQLQVIQASNVGLFGYWAGPNVHVIDRNALGDPFLARLPAKTPWRIGHFTRVVPEGYMETWRTGTNALIDPRLRQLYDQVRMVTQDPIWSRSRFHAIVRLMLRHVR